MSLSKLFSFISRNFSKSVPLLLLLLLLSKSSLIFLSLPLNLLFLAGDLSKLLILLSLSLNLSQPLLLLLILLFLAGEVSGSCLLLSELLSCNGIGLNFALLFLDFVTSLFLCNGFLNLALFFIDLGSSLLLTFCFREFPPVNLFLI